MPSLIDNYISWLKEKFHYKKVGDWYELTTPFVDRFHDYIQIYIKSEDKGKIVIHDDGETIKNLELSGVDLSSEKRKKELNVILNGFGVKLIKGRLEVSATEQNFPLRKHNLIQAILSVDDLFVLAQSKVSSLFLENYYCEGKKK